MDLDRGQAPWVCQVTHRQRIYANVSTAKPLSPLCPTGLHVGTNSTVPRLPTRSGGTEAYQSAGEAARTPGGYQDQPWPYGLGMAGPSLVWYVAYGANLDPDRLGYYLVGGTPAGATRGYPGARDPRPPRAVARFTLPGEVYFARCSHTWHGGVAFYDPEASGSAAAAGYLLTVQQFSDVVAQENRQEPGTDLDLTEVLALGRAIQGDGWYALLLHVGDRDGSPALTFTSSARLAPQPPSAAYLATVARGLRAHGWDIERIGVYLSTRPGAADSWSTSAIRELLTDRLPPGPGPAAR
jgi:hypothetical protein